MILRSNHVLRSLVPFTLAFLMTAARADANNVITGATGRVSIELVGSDAVFSNTLLLVKVTGPTGQTAIITPSGCKLEAPFDKPTTMPFPGLLPLLSEKAAQRGCRVTLDSNGATPEIDAFNAGSTFEFKMCAQTDADAECEGVWSSDPAQNPDSFDHVVTRDLHPVEYPGQVFQMGWEDTQSGGDRDFNDLIAVLRVERDSDGDGLWDDWERLGIDTDGNGTVDFTLPGANWQRKDMYLQIDYMGCSDSSTNCRTGHTHNPDRGAIDDVIKAFNNAPVSNPSGVDGINLHIDIVNSIPHQDEIDFGDFDKLKPQYFPNERRFAYRYGIFAHGRKGTTSSGVAEIFGNDLIVSLGKWSSNPGTRKEQAGTLMHEFGHNLGLLHGGGDGTNNKPNYPSVMNYAYQTGWVPIRRNTFNVSFSGIVNSSEVDSVLDYSRWQLPDLDESKLIEKDGLGSFGNLLTPNSFPAWMDLISPFHTVTTGYRTTHRCPGASSSTTSDIDRGFDWNCNGVPDETDTNININNDYEQKFNTTKNEWEDDLTKPIYSVLTGFNDWSKVKYNFQASDQFHDGVHVLVTENEITHEIVVRQKQETNHAPVAVTAAYDQPTLNQQIQLDASRSFDPEGGPLTYTWRVLQGSTAFMNATTATPIVQFGGGPGEYVFEVTVTDNKGVTAKSTVKVTYVGR